MKLITRDTDYAIRALCCIAAEGHVVGVRHLSVKLKMPHAFLRKVLQRLARAGLLISKRGRGGGFELSRPAEKISVLDVMKVFQKDLELAEHVFKGAKCPRMKLCKLKTELDSLQSELFNSLDRITIKSII